VSQFVTQDMVTLYIKTPAVRQHIINDYSSHNISQQHLFEIG